MKKLLIFLFFICSVSFVYSQEYETDDGTFLLYHFNDIKSYNPTTFKDFGKFGNDAYSDYNLILIDGVYNNSVFLNGEDYIRIVEKKGVTLKDSFTIEMYLLHFENKTQPILSEMGSGGKNFEPILRLSESNKLVAHLITNNDQLRDYYISSDKIIEPNKWYHIALVYDNSMLTLYINGQIDKKENIGIVDGLFGKLYSNPNMYLMIGRSKYLDGCESTSAGCLFGGGLIDELRISDTARNNFDISYSVISQIKTRENVLLEIGQKKKAEEEIRIEEKSWVVAKNLNTIESYEDYIFNYPNGKYVLDANLLVTNFKEQKKILDLQAKERAQEQYKKNIKSLLFFIGFVFVLVVLFISYRISKRKKQEIERKIRDAEKRKLKLKKKRELIKRQKEEGEKQAKRRKEIEKARERQIRKEREKKNFEKSQREKGFELFGGRWVDKKEIPKLKEIQIGLDKNFQDLSPYEFEKFVAKLFKTMGYKTRVTQASNDYGIDVVAEKGNEKIAIQCKRYRPGNPVGNRDIQRLLGAMQLKNIQANHSIIITTSHFTVQAREQAKECAIELWDKKDLHEMVKKYLMNI